MDRTLAWVLANPVISAPIVGATKVDHLRDAVDATKLRLADEDMRELEAQYSPRLPTGF
jgi:1-deoxyxylulose-5-phosphate synthase